MKKTHNIDLWPHPPAHRHIGTHAHTHSHTQLGEQRTTSLAHGGARGAGVICSGDPHLSNGPWPNCQDLPGMKGRKNYLPRPPRQVHLPPVMCSTVTLLFNSGSIKAKRHTEQESSLLVATRPRKQVWPVVTQIQESVQWAPSSN